MQAIIEKLFRHTGWVFLALFLALLFSNNLMAIELDATSTNDQTNEGCTINNSVEYIGQYQCSELENRYKRLPVPGLIFDIIVHQPLQAEAPKIIGLNRSGEFLQVIDKIDDEFILGATLDGLGFHPNRLTQLDGQDNKFVVNGENANALIVVEIEEDGSLNEVSRIAHPTPFASRVFESSVYGKSIAVTPYEYGGIELLLGVDLDQGTAEEAIEIPVDLNDRVGVNGLLQVAQEDPRIIFTTRRGRTLWEVAIREDRAFNPQPLWQFDEGAPRMAVVEDINRSGQQEIIVPLDAAQKIAILEQKTDGTWELQQEIEFPSRFGPGNLAIGLDRNGAVSMAGDGDRELILYRWKNPDDITTLRAYRLSFDVGVQHFLFHDVNGNGYQDLILSLREREDSVAILYGPLDRLTGDTEQGLRLERVAFHPGDNSPEVAQVGPVVITQNILEKMMITGGAGHLLQTETGRKQALEFVIRETLIDEVMYRSGLSRTQLQRRFFPLPELPDEDTALAYYRANYESFGLPATVRLVQIQFRQDHDGGREAARQRAEAAIERLQAGEDFLALAAELTESPRARERGGEVGFLPRNADPWLQNIVSNMAIGEYSSIIESSAGYEIFLLVDEREALVPPFEEVQAEVTNAWRRSQQEIARNNFFATVEQQIDVVRFREEQ